ncbi:MAG: RICIN domain-containing protein [Bacteroidaceae bacterium]|nr:RICIN domain-containing protein [Bacteroidaceae bacterium]
MNTRILTTAALFLCLLSAPGMAEVETGKTYRIVPVTAPGSSLFVKNASLDAGADIVLWTETHVPAQLWTVGKTSTHTTLRNAYTQQYMALKSNAKGSTTRTSASAITARWRLEPVDEAENVYRLLPSTGTLCLALTATEDGTLPTLAEPTDAPAQLWKFVEEESPVTEFSASVRDDMIDSYIARFAQRKGLGLRTFSNGGWGECEQLEVILDAYETTGRKEYLTLATQVYNWFYDRVGDTWTGGSRGNYDWFGYDFNDDVMWQIIAVARLALLTGEAKYRTAAQKNFDLVYQRAYMEGPGMMRWAEQTGERTSTNSCIMGPTEVAACYLGTAGCGEEYFEKARDLYEKQRQYLYNPENGQVYDNRVLATGSMNQWASTYNQGTMLGAATLLYAHYGTPQYRTDAEAIARYTLRELCDGHRIIKVCQVNDGDLCGFKGILMRYVRRFAAEFDLPDYNLWIQQNAFHAYNNRAENGVTASAWLTKSTTETATNPFSCSTAASAAANAVVPDTVPTNIALRESSQTAPQPEALFDLSGRPLTRRPQGKPYIRDRRVYL